MGKRLSFEKNLETLERIVEELESGELTLDEAGDKLMELILRTANGRLTSAETLGHREFVLTKLYVSA